MKRISIVGCPGAGKSTFAATLAEKTKIPLLHLDFFYHEKGRYYEENKEAWIDKIETLVQGDSWIIEGNYGTTYPLRLPKSDTLIFLDIPTWLSVWSVLKRRFQFRNKKREEMPDDWVEKIDPIFFKYVLLFRLKSRKDVVAGIEKYRHKNLDVVTFKTRKAAYKWLVDQTS